VLVVKCHLGFLEGLGYALEDAIFVPTSGHGGAGSDRSVRTSGEWVFRLRAPEEVSGYASASLVPV
jgi:hypothetical protein